MKPRSVALFAALAVAMTGPVTWAQQPLPDAVAAPSETKVLTVYAVGSQVYDCKPDASGKLVWQFREPVATLVVDGKTVGHHYPGPSWELTDGSAVVGKFTGRAPGATAQDIAWLKLEVVRHKGNGQLSAVTTIQRINTTGGVASGPCDKHGAFLSVPYTSDYVFLKRPG